MNIAMEKLHLDEKKLKPEDRRFLVNRALTIVVAHSSGKLANSILFLAIISLLISLFTLTYSLLGLSSYTLIVGGVVACIFGYYWALIRKAQKSVRKQLEEAEREHNIMMKEHFTYALKRR